MKKKMISLAGLAMAAVMMFTAAGCGSEKSDANKGETKTSAPEEQKTEATGWEPSENITVIVPYSAGGTTDLSVRGVTNAVDSSTLPSGVSVLVDNVTGGSGLVGIQQFMNSANDGSTVGIINCDFIMNMVLGATDLSYEDAIPVGCVMMDGNIVFVSADAPYDTYQEFVEYANANGGAKIGDAGAGSVQSVVTQVAANRLNANLTAVHYDDAGAATLAVVSGEIDAVCCSSVTAAAQYEAGNLKPLATSGAQRMDTFPDVPTMAECYPDELGDMESRYGYSLQSARIQMKQLSITSEICSAQRS